ncbi:SsgA family sporulation/cell division regulator [Streptomyces griseoviridis]|uniref:SsgA family sporulation/cell division regulator n=1 Tax=Streptomyces griseoviridis TaxID=45398 RepID=A0ABT9LNF1_STRGD|nr:SsgA family sporulation/cell division regulator [Streptomyces griseoviridis]MDP9685057.1 hypothetical protein [Streptomyces griseoviridis]GGT15087.1 hypothetical protein GCM10010240_55420 [Streptomyces griseoviridis]
MRQSTLALRITYRVSFSFSLRLNCELSYRTDDPLAVTVLIGRTGLRPVRWVFGRDLLAEGMAARCGDGEVVIWPSRADGDGPAHFCLRIGDARTALFEIPAAPVAAWLDGTYAMVPRGTELEGADWNRLLQLAE